MEIIHIQGDNFSKEKMNFNILKLLLSILLTTPIANEFYLVENIVSPQQVIFLDKENILFVQDENVLKYNINSRSYEKILERKPNEFVGVQSNGEIITCEFEHYIIQSKDEFSTLFRVKDKDGNLVKEMRFFETIRPIYMNEEKIVAVTAMDFLEQHSYKIGMESGEKREIFLPRKQILKPKLKREISIKKIYESRKKIYVIEDIFGNVYVYRTLDIINMIKPIFIKTFNPVPSRKPINDAQPDLRLSLKFFLANRYSKRTAPINGPINIPTILAIAKPTIVPTTAPTAP